MHGKLAEKRFLSCEEDHSSDHDFYNDSSVLEPPYQQESLLSKETLVESLRESHDKIDTLKEQNKLLESKLLTITDEVFGKTKVVIRIKKSKTDRQRIGQTVTFDIDSFPAKFLKLYYRRFSFNDYLDNEDIFLFMSMKRYLTGKCCIFTREKVFRIVLVPGFLSNCLC